MKYCNTILETIGSTPLIKLNKVTVALKPLVLVKLESCNPGGSLKDRSALKMIEAAEHEGLLKKGGTIIESTLGNMGCGLAQAAAVKGYRCILVCDDEVAQAKINLLKAYGAEVMIVASRSEPHLRENYHTVARKLASDIPGAFQPSQYVNPNNSLAHTDTTGPEIWQDTEGKVSTFIASINSGNTLAGIARYLKEKNAGVKILGVDSASTSGSNTSHTAQTSQVEGLGKDGICRYLDFGLIDEIIQVNDKDAFNMTRRLAREEGIFVGGTAGAAVSAALQAAAPLSAHDVVVVLMPDNGHSYLSKIFSDEWMKAQGFITQSKPGFCLGDLLAKKIPNSNIPKMVVVSPDEPLQRAIELMQEYQIDQLPVITAGGLNVGSITDIIAMQVIYERKDPASIYVRQAMGKPFPQFDKLADIGHIYEAFRLGIEMIVVLDENKAVGVLTKFDMMAHLRELISKNSTSICSPSSC